MADAKDEAKEAAADKAKKVVKKLPTLNSVIQAGKDELAKISTEDIQRDVIPVHCSLAASYGLLNKGNLKNLDDKLKVMISGVTKAIGRLESFEWDNVVECMMQCPILEPMDDAYINRSDKLIKDGVNFFEFDGSPDHVVVKEVHAWFIGLIQDPDVLKDTKIDVDMMARIVGQTGARITHFLGFFLQHEYQERDIIDVGILRYPDIEYPYFKLYRIRLIAWSDCRRILMVQSDRNGVTGHYNCMKFRPRDSVIAGLREETFKAAVADAEDLFA